MTRAKRKTGIFYGWWIVMASCLVRSLNGGLYFYGFSTYFMAFINEFGWPRAALAGVFSMARIEGNLLGPVEGFLADRYGPRKIMFAGILMMGIGYMVLTRVNSFMMFSLVFVGMVALGHSCCSTIPMVVAIVHWFRRKRGLALGIAASGTGIGGLMIPGLAWIITHYGWRDAMAASSIAILATGIPLSLVMRHKPEQYGYLPDGDAPISLDASMPEERSSPLPHRQKKGIRGSKAAEVDFTPRDAIKTQAFWLLAIAFALRQVINSGIIIHQIPHLRGSGISLEWAATVLGAVGFLSITGRLGFGWLGDLFEKRHLMILSFVLIGIGALMCAYMRYWWQVILFVAVYAPGYGGGNVLQDALRAEYYGRTFIGTIRGLMSMVQLAGTAAGPIFAGWVYDVTGSYRFAFLIFVLCSAAGIVCLLAVRRPRPAVS